MEAGLRVSGLLLPRSAEAEAAEEAAEEAVEKAVEEAAEEAAERGGASAPRAAQGAVAVLDAADLEGAHLRQAKPLAGGGGERAAVLSLLRSLLRLRLRPPCVAAPRRVP